jgi:protein-arginine deiminase
LTFLNDWQDFHAREGEIHCGTNQVPLPLPANRAWWL